jgi:hypothetical protein
MPISVKLSFAAIIASFFLVLYSDCIAFVYYTPYLITFILAFLFMYLYLCSLLIVLFRQADQSRMEYFQNLTTKKFLFLLMSIFGFVLITAFTLKDLTPVISDLVASEFAVHEYKVFRVKPYSKAYRKLSKLYVVDTKNNEFSFVLKNEMLDQLHLKTSESFIVRGRTCLAGFVIDNINGIERK